MKDLVKRLIVLSLVMTFVCLSIIKLYSTYATGEVQEQIDYAFNLTDTTTVEVSSNSNKTIYYKIKNDNPGTVKYTVGYTSNNSTVYVYYDSPDGVEGYIERNDYKTVKLRIENNGNSDDTVEISTLLGYENGGDISVPNDITLVTEKVYTVTFDPNGGNSGMATKVVKYGEVYGTLPNPSRDGYTFLGWSGKNLINVANHNETIVGGYYEDRMSSPLYLLSPNTHYVLSFNYVVNSSSSDVYASVGYGTSGYATELEQSGNYSGSGRTSIAFATPSSFGVNPAYVAFRFVRMASGGTADVDISNVMLEIGESATLYEPYYVTNSVIVTREYDHTLTAMWAENNP